MNKFRFSSYKNLLTRWYTIAITATSVAGLVIILRIGGYLQPLEWVALDRFYQLRPAEPPDRRIVIIGIDELDLRTFKKWPLPDGVIADLIEQIKQQQPKAIGLDIYRDLPIEPGHQKLVKVFQTTPNLIGVKKVSTDFDPVGMNPPPVLQKLGRVGAIDLVLDADSKVRRGLLYLEDKNGKSVPTLSLQLALIYLKSKGVTSKNAESNPDYLQLGEAVFVKLRKNDGSYIRTYDAGYQILGNFRKPHNSFKIVSMRDVLSNRIKSDIFRDRIVLIGSTAPSLKDFFPTSYDTRWLAAPSFTSGVEIHANFTSQIISAALDGRPLMKVWPELLEWLWILFWSSLGATLTWQLRYIDKVKNLSLKRVIFLIIPGGLLVGSTYLAFLWGWWIPIVPPVLAFVASSVVIIGCVAHTAGVIRQIFGRYLSDAVVPTLLESPTGLQMGGERRKVTILVSDLRGFTAIAERLSPEDAVKVLNIYLEHMTNIITSYEGSINELMGDGILVFFGAPNAKEDDAKRAVACAVAMQLAMAEVNQKINEAGYLLELEMGIGINTGIVLVGNIGSEKRSKYAAIGTEVNLTFRIETYTKGGDILISESTFKEVDSLIRVDEIKEVQPKGIRQPISIYQVGGIGEEFNLFLCEEEQVFFPIHEEILLQYSVLDDKHISDIIHKGSFVEISAKQALIKCKNVEEGSAMLGIKNLKLNLVKSNDPGDLSEDIYAKVLDKTHTERGSFYIVFTYLPPDVKVELDELYKSISTKS